MVATVKDKAFQGSYAGYGMEFEQRISSDRLRRLYRYWITLKTGPAPPSRKAIDPVAIPSLLSCIVIAEIADGGRIRYRLVGTDMVDHWGEDFTGRFLDEIMTGDYRDFIQGLFDDAIRERACVWSASAFRWDAGRLLPTERLLLPLSDDGRTVNAVLVGQVFGESGAGAVPPRRVMDTGFSVDESGRAIQGRS